MMYGGKRVFVRKWTDYRHQSETKRSLNPSSNFRIPDGAELPCSTAGAEVSELNITMEEADVQIVPHVMHAVTHEISRIIVLSADTDVFVLMVFYWNILHSHTDLKQTLGESWS